MPNRYAKAMNSFVDLERDDQNAIAQQRSDLAEANYRLEVAKFRENTSMDERRFNLDSIKAGNEAAASNEAKRIARERLELDQAHQQLEMQKEALLLEAEKQKVNLQANKTQQLSGALYELGSIDPKTPDFNLKVAEIGYKYPAVFNGEEGKLPPLVNDLLTNARQQNNSWSMHQRSTAAAQGAGLPLQSVQETEGGENLRFAKSKTDLPTDTEDQGGLMSILADRGTELFSGSETTAPTVKESQTATPGYQVGGQYGTLRFKGGDPKAQESWEQVAQ